MKRLPRLISLALTAACAVVLPLAVHAQAGYDKPIKIALTNSLEHPIAAGATKFAEEIEKKGGGTLKARAYPNATLGNDVQVISSLQGGTIEAAVVSIGLLSNMVKDYSLLTLPAVFHNVREADHVLDGPFGRKLSEKLGEHRLVGLAYFEHGFKNITNSKRVVNKWEDASGLKIRVTQTPSLVDLFVAIGANPVPMPFGELYSAMEQGAIDGMETTLVTFDNGKFAEVQKHITMTQHVYDPLILIFSKPVWDRMTPAQQKLVSDAAAEAAKVQRAATRDKEAKLMVDLRKRGVTITEMSPAELSRMRAKLAPVSDKYKAMSGADVVAEYNAAVAKARAETSK